LQLIASGEVLATASGVAAGAGRPMTNMLIGRPWTVRPISTTRTRSLSRSTAAV
jgi:hypothetical protein